MIEWLNPETIANVWFPICIATYLIIRHEKVIQNNTIAVMQVKEAIVKCQK